MSEKDKIKAILEEKEVPERISPEAIGEILNNYAPTEKSAIKVKRNLLKVLSVAAAATLVVGIGTKLYSIQTKQQNNDSVTVYSNMEKVETISNMRYAENYKEIYDYVDFSNRIEICEDAEDGVSFDTGSIEGNMETDDISVGEKEYTDTYNQEEGVLEADIVKTDGDKIFYCFDQNIVIAEVENGEFKNKSVIKINYDVVEQMYLYEDKLIVVSTGYDYSNDSTYLTVYSKDTYDQIAQYRQDGWFNDVRFTEDGYLYLISNDYFAYDGAEVSEDEIDKYIPVYGTNGDEKCVPYDDIMISCENPNSDKSFINISAFNMNSSAPCDAVDIKSIVGCSGTIYCSAENLYTAYYNYNDAKTEITRFSIDSGKIVPKAGTNVDGYINDQFSMSEYNGYFRIATSIDNDSYGFIDYVFEDIIDNDTSNSSQMNNAVYVLDMDLNKVGSVTDFGLDENIKSVNFSGDMAYIVTFRQTDPLYSIDLSNPKAPVIRDELKVTGYSSYMQKWNDMLLGFGESGDEYGNLNGVKLSMFDNTDPDNLKVIDSLEISSSDDSNIYISSAGLYDRKALLISPERNIIGIPVYTEKLDSDYHVYENESGYYFYSFENGKFKELGKVCNNNDFGIDDYDYYYSTFNRAVIIDDYVYVLSDNEFISADTKKFEAADKLEFEKQDELIIK